MRAVRPPQASLTVDRRRLLTGAAGLALAAVAPVAQAKIAPSAPAAWLGGI